MSKRLQKIRDKWHDIKLSGLKGIPDDLEPDIIFNAVVSADPTPNHKYVDWCLKSWSRGTFQWEDIRSGSSSIIADQLLRFETNKHRIPDPAMRSLLKYRGPGDLDKAMDAAGVALKPDFFDLSNNQQKKMMMAKARLESIHHETESGLKLDTPLTQFASSILGRQTRWCTAAEKDNQFHYYSGTGPLTIIELPDKQRFQMHYTGRDTHTLEDFTILDETDSELNEAQWEKIKPYIPEIAEHTAPRLLRTFVDNKAHTTEKEKTDALKKLFHTVKNKFNREMEKSQKSITLNAFNKIDYDSGRHFMNQHGIEVLEWYDKKKELHCIIKEKDLDNLPHILNDIPYSNITNMSSVVIDYSGEIKKEDIYKNYINNRKYGNKTYYAYPTIVKNMLIDGSPFHEDDFFNIMLMIIKMDNEDKKNCVTQVNKGIESLLKGTFNLLNDAQKLRLVDMMGQDKEISENALLKNLLGSLIYQRVSSLDELKSKIGQDCRTSEDVQSILSNMYFLGKSMNPDLIDEIKGRMKEGVFLEYITKSLYGKIDIKSLTDKDKCFIIQNTLPDALKSNHMETCLDVILQDAPSQIEDIALSKLMVTIAYTDRSKIEENIPDMVVEKTKDTGAPGVARLKETGLLGFINYDHTPDTICYRVLHFLSEKEVKEHTLLAIASSFYKEITPEMSDHIKENPLQIIDEMVADKKKQIAKMKAGYDIVEQRCNSATTSAIKKIINVSEENIHKIETLSMKLSRDTVTPRGPDLI